MAEASSRLMTAEEFYLWQLDQDERYELVDGVARPLREMTGASNADDVIAVNCIVELGIRLRGAALPRGERGYGVAHEPPHLPPA